MSDRVRPLDVYDPTSVKLYLDQIRACAIMAQGKGWSKPKLRFALNQIADLSAWKENQR